MGAITWIQRNQVRHTTFVSAPLILSYSLVLYVKVFRVLSNLGDRRVRSWVTQTRRWADAEPPASTYHDFRWA